MTKSMRQSQMKEKLMKYPKVSSKIVPDGFFYFYHFYKTNN